MDHCFLRYPGGKAKAVTFSYDDGLRLDIRTAQTLTAHNLKGTFNICAAWLGWEPACRNIMPEDIMEHIVNAGHEVAVHGNEHKAPGLFFPTDTIQDVLNCRLGLEKLTGKIIRGMAYPNTGIRNMQNGNTYANIKQILTNLGIVYARSLGADNNGFRLPEDWHNWIPTCHHDNPNSLQWAKDFVEMDVDHYYVAHRYPRLFYVWGHSYEFQNKNNWDHLEALCETLAGKDDIWYATNMEIYEYVKAYESLVLSANGKTFYNPTLYTIWFINRDTIYSIAPGQTLTVE